MDSSHSKNPEKRSCLIYYTFLLKYCIFIISFEKIVFFFKFHDQRSTNFFIYIDNIIETGTKYRFYAIKEMQKVI